jgi:hypothetical protein
MISPPNLTPFLGRNIFLLGVDKRPNLIALNPLARKISQVFILIL